MSMAGMVNNLTLAIEMNWRSYEDDLLSCKHNLWYL